MNDRDRYHLSLTRSPVALAERARAWYDAAYRRWNAAARATATATLSTSYDWHVVAALFRTEAQLCGDRGDKLAAIAARYARMVSL